STIFAILFPLSGSVLASYIVRHEDEAQKIITGLFFFIAFILVCQIVLGSFIFVPESNLGEYMGRKQLSAMEDISAARLFGPMFGPNAFGLWILFGVMFLTLFKNRNKLGWQILAGSMIVLTYSKSAIGSFLLFIIGSWYVRNTLRHRVAALSIAGAAIIIALIFSTEILERLRFSGDISELGTRSIVYAYMINNFTFSDYLIGI